jgi:hypothetical protein
MPDGRYLTVADWKLWARDKVQVDDDIIGAAIQRAEQHLDNACSRRFEVAGAASERVFAPRSPSTKVLVIDDCTSITSIVENGVTLDPSVYQAEPLNNLSPGGEMVPYSRVRRLSGCWYYDRGKATITGNAPWGWLAIPFPIVEACKIVTKATLEVRDARFGLAAILENGIGISPREVTAVREAISEYSGPKSVMVA